MQDILHTQLSQLSLSDLEELYASLDSDYEATPVSIDQFLDDPEYLGSYFSGGLYPYWKNVLREIYPSPFYSPVWCVAIRGAIGLGKSTIAATGMAYDLHRLLCLVNPQRRFGLVPSEKIVFAIMNVTLSLATDVVWDKLTQMFSQSPYFSRHMGQLNSRRKDRDTLFPKRIDFTMGSRIGHTLGKAIMCLCGETKIPLLDGRELSISDLVKETNEGKQNFVYSYDIQRKEVVAGEVTHGIKSGNDVVYRVWLDNGEYVDATENHPFLLRNKKYKKLKDLVVGGRLLPLSKKDILITKIERLANEDVYDITVKDFHNFALSSGIFVHNSAILDEANFDVIQGQTYEAFNSILRRMESRFGKRGDGGKIWIVSSESDKFSVVNKIVDSYKGKDGVYISQAALWEVKSHRYGKPIYSGKTFWVYKGSEVRKPEILKENDPIIQQEATNCIKVPEEHRDSFEADLENSLRDLAGVATISSYKLFRLVDRLYRSLVVSPLFPDTIKLDFDDESDQINNYLLVPRYFENALNKHSPRCIHIDIALSGDRLGIAASYISGFIERKVRDPNTFKETTEAVPKYVTEWAIGIEPTPGKQIPLYKIRLFLQWLTSQGYIVSGVSADGFNSADMLQGVMKMGFRAEVISVDRTSLPYINLRTAAYEGRWSAPNNEILRRELKELELTPDGAKCDHPDKNEDRSVGSKDIADACAGSVEMLGKVGFANRFMTLIQESHEAKSSEQSEFVKSIFGVD